MCRVCWKAEGLRMAAMGSTSRSWPSTRANPAGVFIQRGVAGGRVPTAGRLAPGGRGRSD